MSQMTDYLEGEIIKHIFRTGSFTKPTVLAVALYTAAPGEAAASGTEVTNANNYARVTANPLDATWSAPSAGNGLTDNVGAITFGTPSGSWGLVTHFQICDNATHGTGNGLLYGTLSASKNINNGDPAPYFAAGALDVTFA
jgi:hypothetical protein